MNQKQGYSKIIKFETHYCEYIKCGRPFDRKVGRKTKTCSYSHRTHLQYQNDPNRRQTQSINTSDSTVQAKKKATSLEKYGVESFSNFEKQKSTQITNYGVETSFNRPEIQEKCRKTNIERYGYENPFYSVEMQKIIDEKSKKTIKDRYGVDNPGQIPGVAEKAYKTRENRYKDSMYHSIPELNFTRALNISSAIICGESVDGIFIEEGIIVEYDGQYFHSKPERILKDQKKTLKFLQSDFKVVRIREDPLPALDIKHNNYLELFIDPKFSYQIDSKEFVLIVEKIQNFQKSFQPSRKEAL